MGPRGSVHTPGINGNGDGRTSLAHGWSTGPTSALSAYVFGVRPINAGYKMGIVKPYPGKLRWVEGRVPIPHAAITVKWECKDKARKFVMDIKAPSETSGTIAVPRFGYKTVIHINGMLAWNNGKFHHVSGIEAAHEDDDYVYLTGVVAGHYFIVSQNAQDQ
jgi:alpha-L-rhamnosidase